ncbi:MAG: hypothetical protein AAF289_05615 [Cyanobacteria bacterium P01_A01_bin.135]
MVKYDVTLKLTAQECSAHAILATVRRQLRIADCPEDDIRRFTEEATRKDYSHLLQTCREWVTLHE